MDEKPTRINPYAPSSVGTLGESPPPTEVTRPLQKTAIRWLLVCGISAVPSFVYGVAMAGGQIGGMITGILLFAIGYTYLDHRTASRSWRQRKTIQRTLKIVYGTRIVISTILPLGFYLDLICGIISMTLTQSITGYDLTSTQPMPFGASLLATLVQGVTLNFVLAGFGVIVLGTQVLVGALRRWLSAGDSVT